MRVRLLGTAAGGGFPQWNCACRFCSAARSDPASATPRTQASVAVSADGERWLIINASPDIRGQIESFPPLLPKQGRGTGIHDVLLTTADLDHTLGLLIMREGGPLRVHATDAVRQAITEGLTIDPVLRNFCGIEWRKESDSIGLQFTPFPIPGKPPKYLPGAPKSPGDAIGYRIHDAATGGTLVVACDVGRWDDTLREQTRDCDLLLLDGTFWSDDDMIRAGAGTTRASQMAHWPLSGPEGTLAEVRAAQPKRAVLIHINNTNPILLAGTLERSEVEAAGVSVGADGMEFAL